MFNFKKFKAIADEHNLYGMRRIALLAISPIIYGGAYIYGMVEGFIMGIKEKL